jgi:hypothetical protein
VTAEEILRGEIEDCFDTFDLARCVALSLREMHKHPGNEGTFFNVASCLGLACYEEGHTIVNYPVLTQKGEALYLQLVREGYYEK